MAILIGATLAILSVAVTLYPFFKWRFVRRAADVSGSVAPVPGDVEAIYGAIGTLHLEYQLGNVPERQYREQLANYRLQAALALWEQDRRRMESEALEAEILTARSSLVSDPVPAGHDDAQDAGAGGGTSLPVDSAPAAAPRGSDK